MNTIFRQVLAKERLPQQEGTYFCPEGQLWFNITTKKWNSNVNSNVIISYWLEEIELPTDEEIIIEYNRRYKLDRDSMSGETPNFGQGAQWMRRFVLAVVPK